MKSFQKFLLLLLLPVLFTAFVSFILNWDFTDFKNNDALVLISSFFAIVSFTYAYVFEKILSRNGLIKSMAFSCLFVFTGIFMFSYVATFFIDDYKGFKIPALQGIFFAFILIFYIGSIRIYKAVKQKAMLSFEHSKIYYLKILTAVGAVFFVMLTIVNSDIFWEEGFEIKAFITLAAHMFVMTILSIALAFVSLYFLNKIGFFRKNLAVNILLTTMIVTLCNIFNPFQNSIIFIETIIGTILLSLFITISLAAAIIYTNALAGKNKQLSKLTVSFSKKEAEYLELKNQINPHFLFNNLNTLIAFIELNPQKAIAFGHHLSNVYRHYLQHQSEDFVSLSEELTFIKEYLEIYKAKFESGFTFEITANGSANQYILSASLQELTDNVFKHNNLEEGHPMSIAIDINDEKLVFINSVHPKTDAISNSSGLMNISRRYKILTERDIVIEKTASLFSVSLPILTMEKA